MKCKNFYWLFVALLVGFSNASCSDDDPVENETGGLLPPKRETTEEIYSANVFAHDVLHDIYLWNKEIYNDLKQLDPNKNMDPIKTVENIRYHEGSKEVDKWTMLTDDLKSMVSGTQGVETTFGYNLALFYISEGSKDVCGAVTHVFKNSPAEKIGLKRGDLIIGINGNPITENNMMDLFYASNLTIQTANIVKDQIIPGKSLKITAVTMYEDPILATKVFDIKGKKVGYLAYASFDLQSAEKLVEICKQFKSEGVEELVLDLRYNGGGYVFTENLLASMLAPYEAVKNKEVIETEIWNETMMEMFKKQGESLETRLSFIHSIKTDSEKMEFNTEDANIGLKKIYGLVGRGTASASESIFVGLLPYFGSNIQLIGEQTHGKYCTGIMMSPEDAYKNPPKGIDNWGIYVMINRYADKNGENPCMPDGFIPNYEVFDNPIESYQLGDENEVLLKKALTLAGKEYPETKSISSEVPMLKYDSDKLPKSFLFGKRIDHRGVDKIHYALDKE